MDRDNTLREIYRRGDRLRRRRRALSAAAGSLCAVVAGLGMFALQDSDGVPVRTSDGATDSATPSTDGPNPADMGAPGLHADLRRRTYVIQRSIAGGTDAAVQATGTRPYLRFDNVDAPEGVAGTLAWFDGCHSYTAAYTLADGHLRTSGVSHAAYVDCRNSPPPQARLITEILEADPRVYIDGMTMQLEDDTGRALALAEDTPGSPEDPGTQIGIDLYHCGVLPVTYAGRSWLSATFIDGTTAPVDFGGTGLIRLSGPDRALYQDSASGTLIDLVLQPPDHQQPVCA